ARIAASVVVGVELGRIFHPRTVVVAVGHHRWIGAAVAGRMAQHPVEVAVIRYAVAVEVEWPAGAFPAIRLGGGGADGVALVMGTDLDVRQLMNHALHILAVVLPQPIRIRTGTGAFLINGLLDGATLVGDGDTARGVWTLVAGVADAVTV